MVTDAASFSTLRAASPSAQDLTARQVSRFGSIALCIYPLLIVTPIKDLSEVASTWWTVGALALIIGPSAAMFAVTFLDDPRWTSRLAWVVSFSYAAVIASFPFAWNGEPTSSGSGGWLTPLAGVASVAAVVAMPIPASVAYLLMSVTTTRLISTVVSERTSTSEFVTDLAWGLLVAAVPFVIAIIAIETGRLRDEAQARAKLRATKTAAQRSRRHERAKLDAITHDRVMSILLAASHDGSNAELQKQAQITLGQLDALWTDDDLNRAMTPAEVIVEAETAAAIVDPDLQVHHTASIEPSTTYPLGPVQAMMSAMAESLSNSVRHAGSNATRAVLLTMTSDALTIEISDNGVGFDREQVPSDRLGIELSVHGRMEQITGGSASITSGSGDGTRVTLDWRRPT